MLPQRRKTAEEIAKLRESMGIPGSAQAEAEAEAETAESPAAAPPPPVEKEPVIEEPPAPRLPKPVRSLRKSEQGLVERPPLERVAPVAPVLRTDSPSPALPQRRHNDRELMEMRRVQAAPPDQSINYLKHLAVRWYWVGLAYALPLLGGLCGYLSTWLPTVPYPDFPARALADLAQKPWLGMLGFVLLAVGCVAGMAMAGCFAWKKPRSRHHAGFITIIGVLILVFGIIHQFFTPDYGP